MFRTRLAEFYNLTLKRPRPLSVGLFQKFYSWMLFQRRARIVDGRRALAFDGARQARITPLQMDQTNRRRIALSCLAIRPVRVSRL
jgi:hypothetical protein